MSDRRVEKLPGGKAVLVENGPLRLVIQIFSGTEPLPQLIVEEADYAFECLDRVVQSMSVLRQKHGLISSSLQDEVADTMLQSVRLVQEPDLTPMAAVAGTIADFVANHLFTHRISKVIVDNGGDIAIRLRSGETAKVGFRPDIESQKITRVVELKTALTGGSDTTHWGVTTSGMGGRSLTRGIASAVTVFAGSSSVADAAATAIANSCFTVDEKIQQVSASSIDPYTDLGDMLVTADVSGVSGESYDKALNAGLELAHSLMDRNIIRGALLSVGGKVAVTTEFSDRVGTIHLHEEGLHC